MFTRSALFQVRRYQRCKDATRNRFILPVAMLLVTVGQASAAESQGAESRGVWLEPPRSLAEQKGQQPRSEAVIIDGMIYGDRGTTEPYQLELHMNVAKVKEFEKADLQIPGYVFGLGKVGNLGPRSNVRTLTKVILMIRKKRLEVPKTLLGDLARPEIPQYVVVFRHDDNVVIQIGGPDGSEGYEVEFVSNGDRFLYRLVRFEPGPQLRDYPSPLRKNG